MKKTPGGGPRWGLVRTHTARAQGALGDGARPAFVEFEPSYFPRLYQTAHSESTVDKWNDFSTRLGRGGSKRGETIGPSTAPKKAPSAAEFANSPSGLAYFFSSNLRQLSRVRHDRC